MHPGHCGVWGSGLQGGISGGTLQCSFCHGRACGRCLHGQERGLQHPEPVRRGGVHATIHALYAFVYVFVICYRRMPGNLYVFTNVL